MSFFSIPEGDYGNGLCQCVKIPVSQQQQGMGTNLFGVFIYAMSPICEQNMSLNERLHLWWFPRKWLYLICLDINLRISRRQRKINVETSDLNPSVMCTPKVNHRWIEMYEIKIFHLDISFWEGESDSKNEGKDDDKGKRESDGKSKVDRKGKDKSKGRDESKSEG